MRTGTVLLIPLALCAGCAAANMHAPEVSLSDLRLGGISLMETSLVAAVRLENDSDRPLSIDGSAFRLYINDIDIGRGVSDQAVTVPRLGSAVQKVEFRISNLSFFSKIRRLVESHDFSYRIEGRLYVSGAPWFSRALDITREGRFDFGEDRDDLTIEHYP